jgi:RHS repeat-associated protein
MQQCHAHTTTFAKITLAAFLLFLASATASAQNVDTAVGLTPYQSFHGGDIDSINLSNGNVNIHLPLVTYPQRGLLSVGFSLVYNSHDTHSTQFCAPVNPPQCSLFWIDGISPAVVDDQSVSIFEQIYQVPNGGPKQSEFAVITGDGAQHPLVRPTLGQITGDATGFWSNSSFDVNAPAPTVIIDRRGVRHFITAPNGVLREDPNGNQIKISADGSSQIDTLGRSIPFTNPIPGSSTTDFSGCTGPLPISSAHIWLLPGVSGGTMQFKFCSATIAISIPANGRIPAGGGNSSELQSIVLPNGTAWTFEYNDRDSTDPPSVNYGTLTKITLPTGGTISYTYVLGGGVPCASYPSAGRTVTSRTVDANDGSGPHTWHYAIPTKVTDPLGNDVVHTFTLFGTPACTAFETGTQFYQGSSSSGTLLKTVQTDYNNFSSGNDVWPSPGVVPIRVTTTWPSGQVTKVETDYDANGGGVLTYGNIIAKREYDYGNGAPGPLLRTTTTNYFAFSHSTYLTNNLVALPSSVQVTNGAGTQVALTNYQYDETALVSSGVTTQYDSAPPDGAARGNLTSVHRWLNGSTTPTANCPTATSNGYLVNYSVFNDTGTVDHSVDSCGSSAADPTHKTAYAYSLTYAGAFPTTVTNPLGQSTILTYDFNTGLTASSKDPNNLTTSYTYDNMWRLASVSAPDGGSTTISHQETIPPFSVTLSTKINSTQNRVQTSLFDGVGRTTQTQLTSDPQGTVFKDNTYDALGRAHSVSNPYRSGSDPTTTSGITTYSYDALGRKISETYPDNSVLTTAYCGPSTLVTDPTGKQRRSRADALGRLVEVDEPNAVGITLAGSGCPGTGESIWVTSYSYDTLGNLTSVLQNGSHQRTFTSDSLSHLLTSSNPEVGSITYTYDGDGNLSTKTDARAITTTYGYDTLNRETSRTFSNGGASVTTTYDQSNCLGLASCSNIGHRTSMTDAAGSEAWAYQVDSSNLRSIHVDQRTILGIRVLRTQPVFTKTATYFLDLAGNITQAVYPTGRTVNYTYDAANRPITAADASNGITYATGFQTPPSGTNCLSTAACYTPQGTFYALSIGQSSTFTGLNLKHTYNSRLQPNEFSALSSAGNAIDIFYNFVDPITLKNAGHVYAIANNLDSTRSQSFTYDQLNRITGAQTTSTFATNPGHCWSEVYGIDPWANLQSIAATTNSAYTGCSQESGFTKVSDGNNHFTDFSYDLAGNTANDGVNLYTWNGEGQLGAIGTSTQGTTYAYDGDGRRLAKEVTNSSCVCPGGGGGLPPCGAGCSKFTSTSIQKMYWYGARGEILAETDGQANTTNEYIFFGGQRIAVLPATGNPSYYVEDLLGTSRVITQSDGTVCYDADFYPYGGERSYTNTCPQNYKFEGKERDTETGNDDFGARYYSNRFGRWLSADWSAVPAPVPYANLTNPQTLNLYAMVADDPESFADLDGHDVTFENQRLAEQAARIAEESTSFAEELDAAQDDWTVDVRVVERHLKKNDQGSTGDTRVTSTDENGVTHITIQVDSYRSPDDEIEHEWGHEEEARIGGGTAFVTNASADQKKYWQKGQHNDRPVEKRADKFKDKVNRERKAYRKQQKEKKRQEKEERKKNKEKDAPPCSAAATGPGCKSKG